MMISEAKPLFLRPVLFEAFCPTGRVFRRGMFYREFLATIRWEGTRYGMEVSDYAIDIAKTNGVHFDKDLFSETDFFDLIIFRGTIQHLDRPFEYMHACREKLLNQEGTFFSGNPKRQLHLL